MATRNIVPRATGEGSIGTSIKNWLAGWFITVNTTTVNTGTINVGEVQTRLVSTKYHSSSPGYNLWIGGGGQSVTWTTGAEGSYNTANGVSALLSHTTGSYNTANGVSALHSNTTGLYNTANGVSALYSNTTGSYNTASGSGALYSNVSGHDNTASGLSALYSNTTGYNLTASGRDSLYNNTTGYSNTANGYQALFSNTVYNNITGIGANSAVTGSDQVQLGDSATTTYVYGTVQNRSDIRDKADIRDTTLGLDFIMALRPRDYKWDMRDDYKPEPPQKPAEGATEVEQIAYNNARDIWLEAVKAENIVRDGSKKRNRYHHGLIAQEVKTVLDAQGIDFGGYQNHSINGGQEVLSIGYDELIAPLIKAMQELKTEFDAYKATHL